MKIREYIGRRLEKRMVHWNVTRRQVAQAMGVDLKRVNAALRGIPPGEDWTGQAVQDWYDGIDRAWIE